MQFFFAQQLNNGFLHMTLAGIDDQSIEDIEVYRHKWWADRAITELDGLKFTELFYFYDVHSRTGLRVTSYGLRVTGYVLRVSGYGLRVTGCELRVTGYGLRVTGCALRVASLSILDL